jgi:hypothetical protein
MVVVPSRLAWSLSITATSTYMYLEHFVSLVILTAAYHQCYSVLLKMQPYFVVYLDFDPKKRSKSDRLRSASFRGRAQAATSSSQRGSSQRGSS